MKKEHTTADENGLRRLLIFKKAIYATARQSPQKDENHGVSPLCCADRGTVLKKGFTKKGSWATLKVTKPKKR